MAGMGGGRGKPAKQVKQGKKAKRGSGNPAKRAEQERARREPPYPTPPGRPEAAALDFELPAEFKGLLPAVPDARAPVAVSLPGRAALAH